MAAACAPTDFPYSVLTAVGCDPHATSTMKIMAKAVFLRAGCAIICLTPINASDQDTCEHLNSE